MKLYVKKYPQEGNLAHEYNPLLNILKPDGSIDNFNTDELKLDLNNPLNIECQPSYDGTVNLIINDDKNPPRIINTRFSKLEDNRYKIINRNQVQQTNLYEVGKIDRQTRLFRNINYIPKMDLVKIGYYGQLKGGNYTFYIKFADNDYNKTDVVGESGIVSIFKGTWSDSTSVSGTLLDERTDKSITLNISNIDQSFASIYIYYVRQYSDINGISMEETCMLQEPYPIKNKSELITINGYENIEKVDIEELNIKYNLVTNVKTQAQVQNMLFFGNVQGINLDLKTLQNMSYFVQVQLCQQEESLGWVDENYKQKDTDNISQIEYYNPSYIYYNLGYWPDEFYRLGIVYIMNDDSLSPVFNLRGCQFDKIDDKNFEYKKDNEGNICIKVGANAYKETIKDETEDETYKYSKDELNKYKDQIDVYKYETLVPIYNTEGSAISGEFEPSGKYEMNWIPKEDFLQNSKWLDNTLGVFKNPETKSNPIIDYTNKKICPWYYKFSISQYIIEDLKNMNVKGFFIVRQKRIPTTLCQGITCQIDRTSYIPMLSDIETDRETYFTESFLDNSRILSQYFQDHKVTTKYKQSSGIYSLDPIIIPSLQNTFNGSEFIFKYNVNNDKNKLGNKDRHFYLNSNNDNKNDKIISKSNCVFVNEDVPIKFMDSYGFSTRAGSQEDVKQFSFFSEKNYSGNNRNLLRGIWSSYLGTNTVLPSNTIVDIKVGNYSELFLKEYFEIRGKDNSEFFAISERFAIDDYITSEQNKSTKTYELTYKDSEFNVYRGDCYVTNVTMRLNRNFIDSEVPINDVIIDSNTWQKNYKGYMGETTSEDWLNVNKADLNTVPLGMWLTYKCLSNYNLNLRSEDRQNVDEMALMGNPRTFYPLNDISTAISYKIPESKLQNSGYNSTVGRKRNFSVPNVPYINDLFDNRIMFSNVQVDDDFRNAYRIFQGLSYQDIDRQYGAIVKLIPWGVNLLCVFEHGVGIIPINEKALMQTTTGQSIHLYGKDVIQKQISLLSADFGSIWQESIIRTPLGVYGVDTYAKKIWRYTDSKGFETISDMKIQRFLNDHIQLEELDKYPIIGLRNVKSHYNNYKGDVMFTFYNFTQNEEWNFCFNERMDKWITQYSWTPLYSENINNIFYSLDKKRVEPLSYIYDNRHARIGINTSKNQISSDDKTFTSDISIKGYSLTNNFKIKIDSIQTSFMDINEKEHSICCNWNIKENLPIYIENNSPNEDSPNYTNTLYINTRWVSKIFQLYVRKTLKVETQYTRPLYYLINVITTPIIIDDKGNEIEIKSFKDTISIIVDPKDELEEKLYDKLLVNGFYVHGRTGIFDEISYNDPEDKNRIFPTKWYDKQEPFEFEFVVNGDEVGMHKIFDDLVIISNNVEPESFEFSIIGDVYSDMYRFKTKAEVYKDQTNNSPNKFFENVEVEWDPILNHYVLVINQQARNFNNYGRRLGNITYKEDSWYTNIEPIKFNEPYRGGTKPSETRIRDKYMKIRVRYKGDKLVIITALKTLYRLSFS